MPSDIDLVEWVGGRVSAYQDLIGVPILPALVYLFPPFLFCCYNRYNPYHSPHARHMSTDRNPYSGLDSNVQSLKVSFSKSLSLPSRLILGLVEMTLLSGVSSLSAGV